jgi:hypothetical protein
MIRNTPLDGRCCGKSLAGSARESLSDIIEGAIAGTPRVLKRGDEQEVVVVSRNYDERTRPSLRDRILALLLRRR